MLTHTLGGLQHAVKTGLGPWCLYVFNLDGFHSGGEWFRAVPKYPREEITTEEAKRRYDIAINGGREVRITNGGDALVHHAIGKEIMHGPDFWNEVDE